MSSRVLIIGAGLGGLCLAQGLKNAQIPFHIFERDPNPDHRAQGYRIRINGDGAAAVKHNLDDKLWNHWERTCAQTILGGSKIDALNGEVIASNVGPPPDLGAAKPYTADRTVMRKILLTGLEENISFGKEFKQYTLSLPGVTAHFSDGSSEDGVLLIGADGTRSPVKKQYLPNQKLFDSEGRCIYGKTPLTSELTDRFSRNAMNWMTLIQENTHHRFLTLFLEPIRFQANEVRSELPGDYIYWVLCALQGPFGMPDDQLLKLSGSEAAELSCKMIASWDPPLKGLLELQNSGQTSALRVLTAPPTIQPWEPSAQVTLLGDSIHAMPPTAGSGANVALQDAAALVNALKDGISADRIGKYEDEMRARAGIAIVQSFSGARRIFNMPPFEELKLAVV
ncbi:hypothetical protein MMC20_005193 [Loxospora ochrophaea]|nr:hypothetical protein [Loxospora ochrophaea]